MGKLIYLLSSFITVGETICLNACSAMATQLGQF